MINPEALKYIEMDDGAASLMIELSDGDITVTHGDDGTQLGHKRSNKGDWDKLITFLRLELGVNWVES